MIRLFIEEIDGQPVIKLTPETLRRLGARVGEVVVIKAKSVEVNTSSPEVERQIDIGLGLMHEHKVVLTALAKT